jgi:hypothetical protein
LIILPVGKLSVNTVFEIIEESIFATLLLVVPPQEINEK